MNVLFSSRLKRFLLLSLATVSISSQAITLYKWTDANGTPHFSDVAPTNGVNLKNVQVIEMRTDGRVADAGKMAQTSAPAATGVAPSSAAASAGAGTPSPEQARIKELEDQQIKERCKSLQNNLQNLNAGGRVYEMDAQGQRKYLDDREMELRKQKVAEAISQYCK